MLELQNQIARLEIITEQVVLHLRELPPESREALSVRQELLSMLNLLRAYKEQREQLEDSMDLKRAA